MRISCSQHSIPTRLLASDIWPERKRSGDFFPFYKLAGLFDRVLQEHSCASQEKGKKRAASPVDSPQSTKKRRLTLSGEVSSVDSPSLLFTPPNMSRRPVGEERLPVWRHTFTMRYVHNSDHQLPVGLAAVLNTLRDSSEPTIINMGSCCVLDFAQKLVAVWGVPSQFIGYQDWLLLPVSDNAQDHAAILQSCYELQHVGKVDIQANMNVVFLPEGFCDPRELPFEIQLEVAVSFCLPTLFEPLLRRTPKKRIYFIDECQSHLYHFLYGQDSNTHRNIDIPYFYSILTSASSIQSQEADNAMQPDALLPNLLPFQRRSVAWLLGREGKEVTSEGDIISKTSDTEYSFWDEVEEGNHTFYYNRLGRMLYQEKPATERAFGGILAEEPGLGKTLETLSLILLNAAPENRNPSLMRWDPQARLNVKAVKTTLIVTPSSLAGQWADEISAHAPSLKVLIYDGWSKVTVPITNTPEEKERVRKLMKEKRQKKSISNVSAQKSKFSSAKGSSRKGKKKVVERDLTDSDESPEMAVNEADGEDVLDWCRYVQQYDVVITTYAVLRSDFNVARAAIERPRREDVSYANIERPRSPLVMVEWMRVVMDEVQMVGGGKTEDMVSLIPRLASFAVSGTPARSQVSDLSHVLKFLRVNNIVGSPRMWAQLLQRQNAAEFASFFQKYAIRTVKADIKTELTIPQQTRYIIGIELGPVEKEVYDQTFQATLDELGLDVRGIAVSAGWQVDAMSLRNSIRKLRAICTHPQVGQLQRQGDKPIKRGALKTMEAVLDDLKDKNWRSTMDDAKTKIQGLCSLAQFQQQTQEQNRYQAALQTLQDAEREVNRLIDELETSIKQHYEKGEVLKRQASASALPQDDPQGLSQNESDGGHEKGKGREHSPISTSDDFAGTAIGEEHANKRRALQQRLREVRLVLHRIKFLQGDVYHVLGGLYAASETGAYGVADDIRRDLLKGAEDDAYRIMVTLSVSKIRDGISAPDLLVQIPFLQEGCKAKRSRELLDEAHGVIDCILNEQSVLLWEWRTHIIELLSQRLSPGDGEADGQEYQRTLDNQGEAEVYLQLYAALLADRREALLHERTLLAVHDVREKKLRQTAAAMKAAAASVTDASGEPVLQAADDVDLQPEHVVAHKELSERRKSILGKLGNNALRTIAFDLHGVAASIRNEKDPEKLWAKNASNQLRRLISDQEILHDRLDADLALMRKAFNQRIVYFRQLQEISDSVIQAEWSGPIEIAITEEVAKNKVLDTRIAVGRSRQRYLANLVQSKGKMDEDDDDDTCTLCKCEFTRGYITQCAHIFCEGCMQAWMAKRDGRTCPMCRVEIDPNTLQRFIVGSKPDSEQKPEENSTQHKIDVAVPKSHRKTVYNTIDPEEFEAIQQVEALGDYGSKIQTLVKHLLYLQVNDPGAKSIVFSAWADSLHIVQAALAHNGIRSLRIDQNSKNENAAKKFRKDPNIPVLLLHGERENAGLNLTCASRVFLLESVVHHGFELQAIARIDRLGQTRPTEVYCYYAEDTVERNILELAARQGLSLYTKENAAITLNVSTFELDDAKKVIHAPTKKKAKAQKGDFIFQVDDMLAILFPHMYEDIEYLIPDEARANGAADGSRGTLSGTSALAGTQLNGTTYRARIGQENAVAGPSRLR